MAPYLQVVATSVGGKSLQVTVSSYVPVLLAFAELGHELFSEKRFWVWNYRLQALSRPRNADWSGMSGNTAVLLQLTHIFELLCIKYFWIARYLEVNSHFLF
jgi:hypothetical protein